MQRHKKHFGVRYFDAKQIRSRWLAIYMGLTNSLMVIVRKPEMGDKCTLKALNTRLTRCANECRRIYDKDEC